MLTGLSRLGGVAVKYWAGAVAVLLWVIPAEAQYVKANSEHFIDIWRLRNDCAAVVVTMAQDRCATYIQGVVDMLWAIPNPKMAFCIPDHTKTQDITNKLMLVVANLTINEDSQNAASAVYTALRAYYPCR
jgi:hypothetical protein